MEEQHEEAEEFISLELPDNGADEEDADDPVQRLILDKAASREASKVDPCAEAAQPQQRSGADGAACSSGHGVAESAGGEQEAEGGDKKKKRKKRKRMAAAAAAAEAAGREAEEAAGAERGQAGEGGEDTSAGKQPTHGDDAGVAMPAAEPAKPRCRTPTPTLAAVTSEDALAPPSPSPSAASGGAATGKRARASAKRTAAAAKRGVGAAAAAAAATAADAAPSAPRGVVFVVESDEILVDRSLSRMKRPRYFDEGDPEDTRESSSRCFNCGRVGHRANACTFAAHEKPCYLCAQFGHEARDCPAQLCFKCGRPGHKVRECPAARLTTGSKASGAGGPASWELGVGRCLRCASSSCVCADKADYFRYEGGCVQPYSKRDLDRVKCYVCGVFGHVCCKATPKLPALVTCYSCGSNVHLGEMCPYESRGHLAAERAGDMRRAQQEREQEREQYGGGDGRYATSSGRYGGYDAQYNNGREQYNGRQYNGRAGGQQRYSDQHQQYNRRQWYEEAAPWCSGAEEEEEYEVEEEHHRHHHRHHERKYPGSEDRGEHGGSKHHRRHHHRSQSRGSERDWARDQGARAGKGSKHDWARQQEREEDERPRKQGRKR